jgi:amidase
MPDTTQLLDLSATELVAALRTGTLTSAAVTGAYLERTDHLNPRLHAVITVNPAALDEARALDARPTEQRGALHGLPILIKDNIDVAGLPTSAGSLLMTRHVPAQDAPLVSRLRAAGAVILGKANMTEWANFMALGMTNGYSSAGGQTVNPWQAGADTGGSSSGSGVAVAARLAPVAIGTETSGSILSPAYQNGVIGLKPSIGRFQAQGIVPISHSQDVPGPLARSAEDAALIGAVLAGEAPWTLPAAALNGARIGVIRNPEFWTMAPELRAMQDAALEQMQQAGADLSDVQLDSPHDLRRPHLEVLIYEFKHDLNAYLAGVQQGPRSLAEVIDGLDADPERLQPFGMALLQAAQATRGDLSERAYLHARQRDLAISTELLDPLLATHDALFFPGLSGYALGAKGGYPSVNVPLGLQAGRPVGTQLLARHGNEAGVLALAADLHARLGGFQPAPV